MVARVVLTLNIKIALHNEKIQQLRDCQSLSQMCRKSKKQVQPPNQQTNVQQNDETVKKMKTRKLLTTLPVAINFNVRYLTPHLVD